MHNPWSDFAETCSAVAEALWEHRRKNGGPMHYMPTEVNDGLNEAKGEYPATGIVVMMGDSFVFHQRPIDEDDPWSGLLEWPDVQTTPGLAWGPIADTLIKKGVPADWLEGKLTELGTHVHWEEERGCYCATARLLVVLPEETGLPDDWVSLNQEQLAMHAEHLTGVVNYHQAVAAWVMDLDKTEPRALLRHYLPALPKGPLDAD